MSDFFYLKNRIKTSEADPSRPDNLANWSRTRYQLRHSPKLVMIIIPDMTIKRSIKKRGKKQDEADPSRPDNLANWSRTRYQLRHSPKRMKILPLYGSMNIRQY
ncbi:hypothetical protein N7527_000488 [Penicillium freii]|nr:hypothetical protein N7527_000488 [Penicillium freii]